MKKTIKVQGKKRLGMKLEIKFSWYEVENYIIDEEKHLKKCHFSTFRLCDLFYLFDFLTFNFFCNFNFFSLLDFASFICVLWAESTIA